MSKKSIPLSIYVVFSLLLFSCVPLGIFAFLSIQMIKAPLYQLNQQHEIDQLSIDLQGLHLKLDSYKMLIGFVSQLPAALEILDFGGKREGAIDKKTAFERYKGVLVRAFQQTDNIYSAHIFDQEKKVIFALSKEKSSNQYNLLDNSLSTIDASFIDKASLMTEKSFYITPLLNNPSDSTNSYTSHLIIQILTPIFFKKNNVGTFVCEIDISNFLDSYGNFQWALSDGTYISRTAGGKSAFDEINGLQQIFISENQGVADPGGRRPSIWMPFLYGKDVNTSLWAGRDLELNYVEMTNKNVVLTISVLLSVLLLAVILAAIFTSYFVNRGARQLVNYIKNYLVAEDKIKTLPPSPIKEVSECYDELKKILYLNKKLQKDQLQYQLKLEQALEDVKELQGIIPICSHCNMIRDDKGSWEELEKYIENHSDAKFSHSVCDNCLELHYSEYMNVNSETKD